MKNILKGFLTWPKNYDHIRELSFLPEGGRLFVGGKKFLGWSKGGPVFFQWAKGGTSILSWGQGQNIFTKPKGDQNLFTDQKIIDDRLSQTDGPLPLSCSYVIKTQHNITPC